MNLNTLAALQNEWAVKEAMTEDRSYTVIGFVEGEMVACLFGTWIQM